jgi:DNA-binding Xre family transcriptional regulator
MFQEQLFRDLESGATVTITTETLSKIAQALGKKVSDIFFD